MTGTHIFFTILAFMSFTLGMVIYGSYNNVRDTEEYAGFSDLVEASFGMFEIINQILPCLFVLMLLSQLLFFLNLVISIISNKNN